MQRTLHYPLLVAGPRMEQAGEAGLSQFVDGETEACSHTRSFTGLMLDCQPGLGSSGASSAVEVSEDPLELMLLACLL